MSEQERKERLAMRLHQQDVQEREWRRQAKFETVSLLLGVVGLLIVLATIWSVR